MKSVVIGFILIFLFPYISYTQCGCTGGASVGGLTPVGGTTNIGLIREDNIRISAFWKYNYGDTYLLGDINTETGNVIAFNTNYLGILAGYGLSKKMTLETELGYFANKTQDFSQYKITGRGLSHIAAYAKYNFYHSFSKEFEFTAGLGLRAPLQIENENLPQYIKSSSGAFALILQSFIHKGFRNAGLHLFLINRFEMHTRNSDEYLYGNAWYNSFYATKWIGGGFTGILELRNEYRGKDNVAGETFCDSGALVFILSPQVNFASGNWNCSLLFDYPFYRYYYGKQLANDFSIALNFTYELDFKKD